MTYKKIRSEIAAAGIGVFFGISALNLTLNFEYDLGQREGYKQGYKSGLEIAKHDSELVFRTLKEDIERQKPSLLEYLGEKNQIQTNEVYQNIRDSYSRSRFLNEDLQSTNKVDRLNANFLEFLFKADEIIDKLNDRLDYLTEGKK